MYRIWLMSVLYGPRRFVPMGWSSDHDREAVLDKSWKDQKTFLQQFSSQELFQIRQLAQFLVFSTAGWAVTAEGTGMNNTRYTCGSWNISYRFLGSNDRIRSDDWDGMFLFAGPHTILRCYEDAIYTHLPMEHLDDDGPYTKFLTHALSEIIKERQVTEPIGYVGIILDDIIGEHDRCTINSFLRGIVCCSNSSETGRHCDGAGIGSYFADDVRILPSLYNETSACFVACSRELCHR